MGAWAAAPALREKATKLLAVEGMRGGHDQPAPATAGPSRWAWRLHAKRTRARHQRRDAAVEAGRGVVAMPLELDGAGQDVAGRPAQVAKRIGSHKPGTHGGGR